MSRAVRSTNPASKSTPESRREARHADLLAKAAQARQSGQPFVASMYEREAAQLVRQATPRGACPACANLTNHHSADCDSPWGGFNRLDEED